MEDFLRPIYQDALLLAELEQMLTYARLYQSHSIHSEVDRVFAALKDMCLRFVQWDKSKGQRLWEAVAKMPATLGCLPRFGDLLEAELLPAAYEAMALWGHIEERAGEYAFVSSRSGFLQLMYRGKPMHCGGNPLQEAWIQARTLYQPEKTEYHLLGGGVGISGLCLVHHLRWRSPDTGLLSFGKDGGFCL